MGVEKTATPIQPETPEPFEQVMTSLKKFAVASLLKPKLSDLLMSNINNHNNVLIVCVLTFCQ
jgi:hypothetical protein